MKKETLPLLSLIASMSIFGTLGVVRPLIPLGSGTVALCRAVIGGLMLLFPLLLPSKRGALRGVRPHLPLLFLSGAAIGFNWILLFEAYRYTSVAVATVSYYTAPLFLLLGAALLFGERLPRISLVTMPLALLGLLLVSELLSGAVGASSHLFGVALGLGAAVLYATAVLCNKRLGDLAPDVRTFCQMASAALVLLPYVLLREGLSPLLGLTTPALLWLLTAGILHTGIAYLLYFYAVGSLGTLSLAVFSYLDPIIAVLLSALVLRQELSLLTVIGILCVLLSAAFTELIPSRRHKKEPRQ